MSSPILRPGHGFSDFLAFCDEAEAVLSCGVAIPSKTAAWAADTLAPFLEGL